MKTGINILGCGMSSAPSNWAHMMNQTAFVDRIYYIVREGAGYIQNQQKHYFIKNHLYVISHSSDVTFFLEDEDFYHAYIDYSGARLAAHDKLIEIFPKEGTILKADLDAFLCFLQDKQITNISYQPNSDNFYRYHDRVSLLLESFLCDVEELFPGEKLTNTLILDSIRYIQTNYFGDLSVQKLAGKAHLSKNQYTRLFLKETGTTPYQYIKNYRLDIAVSMLKNGISVAEIAENCGFLSSSAFSSSFKKQYGCSPREFSNFRNA